MLMSTSTDTDTSRRMTQVERVEESARRLLVATAELIAEQGFERTTAAEIGLRAGYSRSMVRDRYGSREALFETLVQNELDPRIMPRPAEGVSGLDRVLSQVDMFVTLVKDEPIIARCFFVLAFETAGPIKSLRPWFQEWFAAYEEQMKQALRDGAADGSVRADVEFDLDFETELFFSHAVGLAYRWTIDVEGFDYLKRAAIWREWLRDRYAA